MRQKVMLLEGTNNFVKPKKKTLNLNQNLCLCGFSPNQFLAAHLDTVRHTIQMNLYLRRTKLPDSETIFSM